METMRRPLTAAAVLWLLVGAAPFAARGELITLLKAKYNAAIRSAALKNGLEPALVHAVIRAESAYNRWAVSTAGSSGTDAADARHGRPSTAFRTPLIRNPTSPAEPAILKDLSTLYPGRTDLILAAYNAGQSAVTKYNGVPPYAETKDYIAKVQADYVRSLARGKTRIFTFIDAAGRRIMTNDPRLALVRDRRP